MRACGMRFGVLMSFSVWFSVGWEDGWIGGVDVGGGIRWEWKSPGGELGEEINGW